MKRYYGGIIAEPQGVRIKDNSTGVWGFGRSHAHQRVAGRGFDLRPGHSGDLHRQRNAGELQGRGGPGRERLLRGAGDRGRRTARRVHAAALRGQGRRRQRGDVRRHTLDGQAHHGYPDQQLRPPAGAWATIRPARPTSSRSTNPATRRAATSARCTPAARRTRTTSRRARRSS